MLRHLDARELTLTQLSAASATPEAPHIFLLARKGGAVYKRRTRPTTRIWEGVTSDYYTERGAATSRGQLARTGGSEPPPGLDQRGGNDVERELSKERGGGKGGGIGLGSGGQLGAFESDNQGRASGRYLFTGQRSAKHRPGLHD